MHQNLQRKLVIKLIINRHIVDHLDGQNITPYGFYHWLSHTNTHVDADSIFVRGYFDCFGIEKNEDKTKAFESFINALEQNHDLAYYYVGECYQYGYGITKIEKLAFKCYEKLANKDFAAGQLQIGYFYENGVGVKKDLKKAICWYEKAADLENMIAMHKLGLCYKNGVGVDVD